MAVHGGQTLAGPQQATVLPADAHRGGAVDVEQGNQLALDGTGEDHADHIHDLGRGHPQAAAELRIDAQSLQHRVDLGTAAVDDHGSDADLVQEEDVLCEGPFEILIDHGVTAVLDDHGGALVGAQPGYGLKKDGGLDLRGELGGRAGARVCVCHVV